MLIKAGIAISMDGEGPWRDTVLAERLLTIDQIREEVYQRAYANVSGCSDRRSHPWIQIMLHCGIPSHIDQKPQAQQLTRAQRTSTNIDLNIKIISAEVEHFLWLWHHIALHCIASCSGRWWSRVIDMVQTRAQGRPVRGDTKAGRDWLIQKTRAAMKSKPKVDMQRREIAEFAGVTPALVSYYFPDKWRLFEAAAQPVIEEYTSKVHEILNMDYSPVCKVRSLTRLFVEFNFEQGYLLDFYLEQLEKHKFKKSDQLVVRAYAEMMSFFGDLIEKGIIRGESASFVQSALWALSKYIAQQTTLDSNLSETEKLHVLQSRADTVCDLFMSGVGSIAIEGNPTNGRERCQAWTGAMEARASTSSLGSGQTNVG